MDWLTTPLAEFCVTDTSGTVSPVISGPSLVISFCLVSDPAIIPVTEVFELPLLLALDFFFVPLVFILLLLRDLECEEYERRAFSREMSVEER